MKTLFCIFFLVSLLFGSENIYAIKAQIIEKIVTNISFDKNLIIYSDNKNLLFEMKKNAKFPTSANCENATLLIIENKNSIKQQCKNKPIFVLEYDLLKQIPQSLGAMFWEKGRPNIVIVAPRAQKHSIAISENLSSYVEDKIW